MLDALDEDALVRTLDEPKNALIKQYKYLFNADNIDLEFDQDALRAIAKKSIERNTGARGLRSIVEATLRDIMFTAPSDETISKITITADCVNGSGRACRRASTQKKKPAKKAAKNGSVTAGSDVCRFVSGGNMSEKTVFERIYDVVRRSRQREGRNLRSDSHARRESALGEGGRLCASCESGAGCDPMSPRAESVRQDGSGVRFWRR